MADAAVESLIEYLHQVQRHKGDLISNAKDLVDIDKLEKDLRPIRDFLGYTPENRRQDDGERRLLRRIRDVVYEVEDIINASISMTQAADANSKHYFLRAFQTSEMLRSICRQVNSICADIKNIDVEKSRIDFTSLGGFGDERPRLSNAPPDRQVNVVGVEDEAEKLIGYLSREAKQLDILTVVGVAGLGKTTLAWKVFGDPTIKYKYPTRIWIYVSAQFTKKDIFLSILREFMRLPEVVYGKSDEELATLVASHLERRKFLIVMDDVWKADNWKELQIAFPMSNKMGKVLITSRYLEVANFANPNTSLQLRFLDKQESWLLFQQEVFGKSECPPKLKDVGEVIAGKCHGLPLTIMVIAGMLVEKYSAPDEILSARTEAWQEVLSKISRAYHDKDPLKLLEEAISLSYDKLSYNLKECFLYLAIFPEDYEIPVQKLIHLWIAEGFVQHKASSRLEETAASYLEELITRNLVKTDKINCRGKVKTCRIHDKIRDLCRREASEKENLLQELSRCGDGVFEPLVSDARNCYRLCVHSGTDTLDFISSKPYGPRLRSFISFSKDEITLPLQFISAIPAAFKLLRVLEATPIKFTKFSRNLYHLIHLKYIAISFSLSILPAAFSDFWNIQTLIVNTTSYTLEVKADIWKMTQLRHFKTNASATLPESTGGGECEKLQTLGTISPQSCSEEVFKRAPNLKKLGIRGQLALLLDGKIGSFGSLRKLVNLEKLRLLNSVLYSTEEGQLPRLPPASEFPPKLRSLTLSNTFLKWSPHMAILGSLQNLEVLKLKDYAFVGEEWEASDGGFRNLEVLHIGCTDLVNWTASSHHFPRLRCLELRNCEELKEVPIGLADIPSLHILGLYRTTTAAASAVKVEEKRKQAQQSPGVEAFELSIFPPHE